MYYKFHECSIRSSSLTWEDGPEISVSYLCSKATDRRYKGLLLHGPKLQIFIIFRLMSEESLEFGVALLFVDSIHWYPSPKTYHSKQNYDSEAIFILHTRESFNVHIQKPIKS